MVFPYPEPTHWQRRRLTATAHMVVAAMARRRDPGVDLFPPQVLMDELKAKETALAEAEEAVKVRCKCLAGWPGSLEFAGSSH